MLEAVLGIALMGIVLLGLAQVFTLSVMNNMRSDQMSSAVFLAQQRVESLRNFTDEELDALTSESTDELLDVNSDGTLDYRRITEVQALGFQWEVKVLVFSASQSEETVEELIQNPQSHEVRAQMITLISR